MFASDRHGRATFGSAHRRRRPPFGRGRVASGLGRELACRPQLGDSPAATKVALDRPVHMQQPVPDLAMEGELVKGAEVVGLLVDEHDRWSVRSGIADADLACGRRRNGGGIDWCEMEAPVVEHGDGDSVTSWPLDRMDGIDCQHGSTEVPAEQQSVAGYTKDRLRWRVLAEFFCTEIAVEPGRCPVDAHLSRALESEPACEKCDSRIGADRSGLREIRQRGGDDRPVAHDVGRHSTGVRSSTSGDVGKDPERRGTDRAEVHLHVAQHTLRNQCCATAGSVMPCRSWWTTTSDEPKS